MTTESGQNTQWERYEVFLQDRPDRPHVSVGSVHAPDAEVALQNARDVFVRRPYAHSLWVVPATEILARTQQELAREGVLSVETDLLRSDPVCYYVFQKQSQRRSMVYVAHTGEVMAATPEEALRLAIEVFGVGAPTYVWWVCPGQAITGSRDSDNASLFTPAISKTYRQPQEYRTVTMMHTVKSEAEDEAD